MRCGRGRQGSVNTPCRHPLDIWRVCYVPPITAPSAFQHQYCYRLQEAGFWNRRNSEQFALASQMLESEERNYNNKNGHTKDGLELDIRESAERVVGSPLPFDFVAPCLGRPIVFTWYRQHRITCLCRLPDHFLSSMHDHRGRPPAFVAFHNRSQQSYRIEAVIWCICSHVLGGPGEEVQHRGPTPSECSLPSVAAHALCIGTRVSPNANA